MNENVDLAVVAGSFTPFHRGHMLIVQTAASVADRVVLFVSAKGRENVADDVKLKFINECVVPILPRNVELVTVKGSPVRAAYELVGSIDAGTEPTSVRIVGSTADNQSTWSDASLSRYVPRLHGQGLVRVIDVDRGLTRHVSGTAIRGHVARAERQEFDDCMPDDMDKELAWRILTGER